MAVDFSVYRLHFVLAGEVLSYKHNIISSRIQVNTSTHANTTNISVEWRNLLASRVNVFNPARFTVSIYGTADAGFVRSGCI